MGCTSSKPQVTPPEAAVAASPEFLLPTILQSRGGSPTCSEASGLSKHEKPKTPVEPISMPARIRGIPRAASTPLCTVPLEDDAQSQSRNGRRRLGRAKTLGVCNGVSQRSGRNGFSVVSEAPTLRCDDANIAPYTLPAQALTHEPRGNAIVTTFDNDDKERKIHCNVELDPVEQERLRALQTEAKTQGMAFFPSVSAMATRFLSRSRNDHKKALKLMQATQDWRANYFKDGPITAESVMDDMKHGIVYFVGRDAELRPAIVVRANRIPDQWYKSKSVDRLIRLLIFCMEYLLRYMLVPGRVENLSVIVDLQGLGFAQVPLGALREVYSVMSHHYIGRVFRFYVCNASSTLLALAGMAKAILTDRQRQKLVVLNRVSELQKDFALHQLEQDLGGSRPLVDSFFPFPLVPGPFNAGYAGEADADAVPNVHGVFLADAAVGRLWDPKLSRDDNTKIEFAPDAAAILERCGLAVPISLRLRPEYTEAILRWCRRSRRNLTTRKALEKTSSDKVDMSQPMLPDDTESDVSSSDDVASDAGDADDTEVIAAVVRSSSTPELETVTVACPGNYFNCTACMVH